MNDLLLTQDGDLFVSPEGDVDLTDSPAQAIRIRLQWFLDEWIFRPDFGLPYYERIFTKPYNRLQSEQIIRQCIVNTPGVLAVTSLESGVDPKSRILSIAFEAKTEGGSVKEEVAVNA